MSARLALLQSCTHRSTVHPLRAGGIIHTAIRGKVGHVRICQDRVGRNDVVYVADRRRTDGADRAGNRRQEHHRVGDRAVPASPATGPVTFIWLAGLGSNLGERQFTLAVNGKDVATFTTSSRESWEVAGAGGARLTFQTMMVDRHRDRFGFMRLSLPPEMVTPGKPVELRITGEAAGSSVWVMTFTTPLADGVTASTRPVILREGGKSVQPLDLEIVNLGEPTTGVVTVTGLPAEKLTVPHRDYPPLREACAGQRTDDAAGPA